MKGYAQIGSPCGENIAVFPLLITLLITQGFF